jgi:dTDP-4-dehydrorhamnose 3,5-epimerase
MKLKITPSGFNGLFVLEPTVYEDDRGYFMEAYNKEDFLQAGIHLDFVQDNQSKSTYGVVRGLHFQIPPHSQMWWST